MTKPDYCFKNPQEWTCLSLNDMLIYMEDVCLKESEIQGMNLCKRMNKLEKEISGLNLKDSESAQP